MALLRTLGAAADASSWKADWPPIVLLHGTADQTVPWEQSHDFAMRLRACGAYSVTERYYENKSHTDPIVEDPLCGGDVLLADLLDMVLGPADRTAELKVGLWPSMLPAPRWLFPLAKRINPF
jgi:prenylcysteine alpha-carboxyl methylesterase